MVLMPGFQSTRLAMEGTLESFFFLYADDSIQGNPETCKQSSIMLNYEVENIRPASAGMGGHSGRSATGIWQDIHYARNAGKPDG